MVKQKEIFLGISITTYECIVLYKNAGPLPVEPLAALPSTFFQPPPPRIIQNQVENFSLQYSHNDIEHP